MLVFAAYICIHPGKDDVDEVVNAVKHEPSLKKILKRSTKQSKWEKFTSELRLMLKTTGQSESFYKIIGGSLVLSALGAITAITFDNMFLVPVLAIGFAGIPFVYLQVQTIRYKKAVLEQLEQVLELISISFERSENIISSVTENIPMMEEPVSHVFEEFLFTVNSINPNVANAIMSMKPKLNNAVFWEWCDVFRDCSENRNEKRNLRPVVNKLREINSTNRDLKNILYSSVHNFRILVVIAIITAIGGIYLMPAVMNVQLSPEDAKLMLSVNVAVIVSVTAYVLVVTHDIKYDV